MRWILLRRLRRVLLGLLGRILLRGVPLRLTVWLGGISRLTVRLRGVRLRWLLWLLAIWCSLLWLLPPSGVRRRLVRVLGGSVVCWWTGGYI